MSATEITLTSGVAVIVDGSVEETERALSDAARSGHSRLAWCRESETDRPIALNPAHVISLRSAASPDQRGSPDAEN